MTHDRDQSDAQFAAGREVAGQAQVHEFVHRYW